MAIDLSGIDKFPYFHIESSVPSATMVEIKIPTTANTISIGGKVDLKIAQNGATDGGAPPANYGFCLANNYLQFKVPPGLTAATSVFVSIDTGANNAVYLILE